MIIACFVKRVDGKGAGERERERERERDTMSKYIIEL